MQNVGVANGWIDGLFVDRMRQIDGGLTEGWTNRWTDGDEQVNTAAC